MAGMTFRDLPKDVKDLPLTTPALAADVVDLIIGDRDRRSGAVGFMLCDAGHRGIQPLVVTDVPGQAELDALSRLLELVLPLVAEQGGSVLVGRGRPGGLPPTDDDRVWHQCAIDVCRAEGVPLLAFCIATPQGVEALPEPLSAAS
jgi:hypothetical protein